MVVKEHLHFSLQSTFITLAFTSILTSIATITITIDSEIQSTQCCTTMAPPIQKTLSYNALLSSPLPHHSIPGCSKSIPSIPMEIITHPPTTVLTNLPGAARQTDRRTDGHGDSKETKKKPVLCKKYLINTLYNPQNKKKKQKKQKKPNPAQPRKQTNELGI